MIDFLFSWLICSILVRGFIYAAEPDLFDKSAYKTTPQRLIFVMILVPIIGDIVFVGRMAYNTVDWIFKPSFEREEE